MSQGSLCTALPGGFLTQAPAVGTQVFVLGPKKQTSNQTPRDVFLPSDGQFQKAGDFEIKISLANTDPASHSCAAALRRFLPLLNGKVTKQLTNEPAEMQLN